MRHKIKTYKIRYIANNADSKDLIVSVDLPKTNLAWGTQSYGDIVIK